MLEADVGKAGVDQAMTAYDLFVLAVAGANGGLAYWIISRRREALAWIKARRRR